MSQITVKEISPTSLKVGNKVVYKNTDNQWISVSELTTNETDALNKYLIENDALC